MPATGEPPMLDEQLLKQLKRRWKEQGAPIAAALRPGLTDDEMDRLTSPIGLRLPREARRWWGWHDGASPQIPGRDVAAEIGPRMAFLPLADAVSECRRIRALLMEVSGGEGDPDWKWSWLPMNADKRPLVFDCGVEFDAPVPVRSFFFEDPAAGAEGARSIGELVTIWLEAIDCGAWAYERQRNRWTYDWTKLDPDVEMRRLT
jgi:cell wall assembly regulator SMI1